MAHRLLLSWTCSVVFISLVAGCITTQGAAPGGPPRDQSLQPLRGGCERDLSGCYAHAEVPSYRYRAWDDGGSIEMIQWLAEPSGDGGWTAPSDAGHRITLRRGDGGIRGSARALVQISKDQWCEAAFATEILRCPARSLELRSEARASFGEGCAPAQGGAPATMVEHRLTLLDPDGGTPTPHACDARADEG